MGKDNESKPIKESGIGLSDSGEDEINMNKRDDDAEQTTLGQARSSMRKMSRAWKVKLDEEIGRREQCRVFR